MPNHTVQAYWDGTQVVVADENGNANTHCRPGEAFVWCTRSASLSVTFKQADPFSPASPAPVSAQSSNFVCDAPVIVTGSPGTTYPYGVVVTYQGTPHPLDPKVIIDPKMGFQHLALAILIAILALGATFGIYRKYFRTRI